MSERKTKLLNFRIGDELFSALKTEADRQGLTVAAAVRQAVRVWLDSFLPIELILSEVSECCDVPLIELAGTKYCLACGKT